MVDLKEEGKELVDDAKDKVEEYLEDFKKVKGDKVKDLKEAGDKVDSFLKKHGKVIIGCAVILVVLVVLGVVFG